MQSSKSTGLSLWLIVCTVICNQGSQTPRLVSDTFLKKFFLRNISCLSFKFLDSLELRSRTDKKSVVETGGALQIGRNYIYYIYYLGCGLCIEICKIWYLFLLSQNMKKEKNFFCGHNLEIHYLYLKVLNDILAGCFISGISTCAFRWSSPCSSLSAR